MLLPDMDEQDALRLAERLRAAFAATPYAVGGRAVTATVSIGVAVAVEDGADADPIALLKAADGALYRAKIAGRNCVKCARQSALGEPAEQRSVAV